MLWIDFEGHKKEKATAPAVANDHQLLNLLYMKPYALRITASNREIIAIINKIWINPPALYTKNPNSQPMINITAIKYNRLLIILFLND